MLEQNYLSCYMVGKTKILSLSSAVLEVYKNGFVFICLETREITSLRQSSLVSCAPCIFASPRMEYTDGVHFKSTGVGMEVR